MSRKQTFEVQHKRLGAAQIHDQENEHLIKGKLNPSVPVKRQGLAVRGALGDLSKNTLAQRENNGKAPCPMVELEKKATQNRAVLRSNYSHVSSKIDTGLVIKNVKQPSRPPLRREESTAYLATRAAANAWAASKENQNKPTKKNKLPVVKERIESKNKQVFKAPIESLRKLELVDIATNHEEKSNGLINKDKLKKTCNELAINDLPEDVEDIDAADNANPSLMSIYIKDIYRYLTELEEKYPIEPNHLRKQTVVTGKMRATLIDWLVEIQRQFLLLLETLHLTVGIIDRYLQAVPNIPREQIQLVGVTAMVIASKYEEIHPPTIADFVFVTANAYTRDQVFECERDIITKLGFCLARPIPLSFLRRFVKVGHGTLKQHNLAKYLVELSFIEYSLAHYRPSELSAAAICLSFNLLSSKTREEVWTPTLRYYTGYSLEHIEPIMKNLAKMVLNVEKSKCKAVYNKYLDPKLSNVSSLPELKGDTIIELTRTPLSS